MKNLLDKNTTLHEFETNYWYATDLKSFAKEIGIRNSSKLRKDELEQLIKHYLKTGEIGVAERKNVVKSGKKDLEIGLNRMLPIRNYTSNKLTKKFIIEEAQKIVPNLKIRSGVWYRINRWRDEKTSKSNKITYGDLIDEFIKLNEGEREFEKIPTTLFNNFVSDFLKNEPKATRNAALKVWEELKNLKIKKEYNSWKKYQLNQPSKQKK